jgi:gamma-resorcylate decarboxylase
MQGKVALEEHFAIAETLKDSAVFSPEADWPELKGRLLDVHGRRLREMDAHGIEVMLLSLNAPAVQAISDTNRANEISRRANDFLAEQIQRQPDRFGGFAALPMQAPDLAARELERCVRELGFCGALVNGFSQVGGGESGVHALRLMGSGLFDAHPRLNIVIGHMGEGLPYSLWRIDNRNKWMTEQNRYPAKRKIADYFRQNFYITTSGNFRTQTLVDAMLEIGSDRILFSADWPFENIDHASDWFDVAPIAENDRQKIGRDNAMRLFKLDRKAS